MQLSLRFRQISAASILALSLGIPASAADQAPKLKYEIPMTKEAFYSPLGTKAESECNQLFHLLLDREMLMDPQQRKARLEVARPILNQYAADMKQLAVTYPSMQKDADSVQVQSEQRLALLGDEQTNKKLEADAVGTDADKAGKANAILIENRWTLADGNNAAETQIANDLEKLDHQYSQSEELTNITFKLSGHPASEQLHDRLMDLAIAMDNPAATKQAESKKIRDAARETLKKVGHPFVLAGKMPDGKDFTTADWKGKVILVDFWATWCGPCKQELPKIEKLYQENHDKGFEIVSVSNDFDLKALAKYTAENNMPWPQLVNAEAVQKHTWNPTTLGYGIDGIPRMFVIDKNGILLTANAKLTYEELVKKALAEN